MSRGLCLVLALAFAAAGFTTAYVLELPQLWVSHALWLGAGLLVLSVLVRKDPYDPKAS